MKATTSNTIFNFIGIDCQLVTQNYQNNGALAVQVVAADTKTNIDNFDMPGTPIAMLSTNLDQSLEEGEFIVKNYSENTCLFEAVLAAGLIADTGKRVDLDFVSGLPVCRLPSG